MARQFIVVEGLIGVGKTSLCRLIQREWKARLVLEPAETNPFLESFYEQPERYAFPAQMYYLLSRWRQQATIRQEDLFAEMVVSDYLWEKDRMFAEKTLDGQELRLYDEFSAVLGASAPKPDLVIFLDAPIDTILKRIARRQAPGEHLIERSYLVDLRARYDELLRGYTACPVLLLDNQDLNYVDNPDIQHVVLEKIRDGLLGKVGRDAPGSSLDREAQPGLFG